MNRIAVVVSLCLVVACAPCPTPTPPGCTSEGTGTVVVISTGLPSGVVGTIHVTGATAQTVTGSRTLVVRAGAWSVTAERATEADRFVRTVYLPTINPTSFCLASGGTQDVIVSWAPVATSNTLWATNANDVGQFLGFKNNRLVATSTVSADVVAQGGLGGDIAFDRDGNVWTPGATVAEAALNRYPASSFVSSRRVVPDVQLNLSTASCVPLIAGLAFDPSGNLYLSSPCLNAVLRIDAAQLTSSATVTPSLTIPMSDPAGLAFDRAGNLWVVSRLDSRVWRYDAAQLGSTSVSAPAFKLGGLATSIPMDNTLLAPSWLAFDSRGDLWANDFAGNTFYRLAASALRGTGQADVQPQVRITLGVLALLEGFAFDEEGGLWSAGAGGTVVRLSPVQLDVSSGPGMPTTPQVVLTSADIGSAANLALYPAPAGLPLFHALP